MENFYHFTSSEAGLSVNLNKELISSITAKGFGVDITMSNGNVFKVNHTLDQVFNILTGKPNTSGG